MRERIDRDTWFLRMAQITALRSTCVRGHVGAIIVRDNRPISLGYNGSPPGQPHCLDVGCQALDVSFSIPGVAMSPSEQERLEHFGCQRAIHAEANALVAAARLGGRTEHATVYCTHSPCIKCAQLLVTAGIHRFVYSRSYRAEELELMRDAAIVVEQIQVPEIILEY